MLANFCQHLPIYNQANWKPIHPLASLLPKMVVVLKENVQKRLTFRPPRLTLTQNLLHKRQMHKYNQWFSKNTWDTQSPGYRGWKTRCPGRGKGEKNGCKQLFSTIVSGLKCCLLAPGLCIRINSLSRKGHGKQEAGIMKKMSQIQIHKCKVLSFKWICTVFENDMENHHALCFILKSIIPK